MLDAHRLVLPVPERSEFQCLGYPADCLVFPCVIKRPRGEQPKGGLVPKEVDFGRPWTPAAISKEFSRYAARAGLAGFSLHSQRHTHATQRLLNGVAVHVVAQRLGHSTPVITMTIYEHVPRRAEDQAVGEAGDLLRAALRCACDGWRRL